MKLIPNAPKRIRVDNPRIEDHTRKDPITGLVGTRKAYVLDVTEEDGVKVSKTFSTLADKLAVQLKQLENLGQLRGRLIEVVWHPRGYATEYELRVIG